MQRKKSKSLKKPPRKVPTKKNQCSVCQMDKGVIIHMQHALFRKYSSQHYSYLEEINSAIKKPEQASPQKQYMEKYYKAMQRKHQFHQVKEIYKLHVQSPRLFLPQVRDILIKCHHRKRLLEYFKIAKILGLKVESVKFSTFLFSVSKSLNPNLQKKSYDRIIGQISHYQFSEQIQKQLLETLEGKELKKVEESENQEISLNSKQLISQTKFEEKSQSFAYKNNEESRSLKEKTKLKIYVNNQEESINPFEKTIRKAKKEPRAHGEAFIDNIELNSEMLQFNETSNTISRTFKKVMTKKRVEHKATPPPSFGTKSSNHNSGSLKNPLKHQSSKKQHQNSTVKKIPLYENSKNLSGLNNRRGSLASKAH